jgi:DMSO/TMAO reductase YedYZ molybdopterin-dependent catalytic subunit
MTLRFTNSAILILIILLTLTGLYGLVWTLSGWMFDVHRAAGWSLIALIPWKTAISLRSLKRGWKRNFDRGVVIIVSIGLAFVTLAVLGLALVWTWRIGPDELWLRQTAISWHWLLALVLLPPAALHIWRRWPRPRRTDFVSRRAFLKLAALTMAGVAGWSTAELIARVRGFQDAARRFTGSREQGSLTGNLFPITQSAGEGERPIDISTWRLKLHGAVNSPQLLSYEAIRSLPASEVTATIDCTLGWYSTQVWRGIRLTDLLAVAGIDPQANAIRLKAATGYSHLFTLTETREILLATHIGHEPLDHWHGFPVRAVVPSRRGWFWVKWLAEIEVFATSPVTTFPPV